MRLLALAFALGVSSSASVMAADIDTPRRLVRVSPGFVEQDLVNARPVAGPTSRQLSRKRWWASSLLVAYAMCKLSLACSGYRTVPPCSRLTGTDFLSTDHVAKRRSAHSARTRNGGFCLSSITARTMTVSSLYNQVAGAHSARVARLVGVARIVRARVKLISGLVLLSFVLCHLVSSYIPYRFTAGC